jgi:hypothetical protein
MDTGYQAPHERPALFAALKISDTGYVNCYWAEKMLARLYATEPDAYNALLSAVLDPELMLAEHTAAALNILAPS